jgi:hypothetical protein
LAPLVVALSRYFSNASIGMRLLWYCTEKYLYSVVYAFDVEAIVSTNDKTAFCPD